MVGLLVFSCQKQEPTVVLEPGVYEVNIKAEGIFNGIRAHLLTQNQRRQDVHLDTAMIANGTAAFKGKVAGPRIVLLGINGVRGYLQLILEPGVTDITVYKDSIQYSKIEGGPNNLAHAEYKAKFRKGREAMSEARRQANIARRDNDLSLYNQYYQEAERIRLELREFNHKFIKENSDTEFALLLLETLLIGGGQDLEKFQASYDALEAVRNKNTYNQNIGGKIKAFMIQLEALATVDIGKVAPDFRAPTPDGEQLALSDIKGKATIIDFWASWCGPCRRENPNVVRVYEKYHDKGLEIISVSLDRPGQKQAWLDAIEKDRLTWHHVSNLKYFNDPVAQLYHVNAIPATFILDEEGKIVAKKLRGKALEDQIAQLLN